MNGQIYVIGLEGSGTRWVRDILRYTVGNDRVTHFSLPRFYAGEGRYFHQTAHYGDTSRDKFVIVVRDSECAMRSNLQFCNNELEVAERNRDAVRQILWEYISDPNFDTHIFSYETAVYLQDAYVLPFVQSVTGRPFPVWNRQIEYRDGNKKYLRGLEL